MSADDHPVLDLMTPRRRILKFLYEHPSMQISTPDLVRALHPELNESVLDSADGTSVEPLQEAQQQLESLIVEGLVTGKRAKSGSQIIHDNLELTAKGEKEAIKSRREPQKLVLDV